MPDQYMHLIGSEQVQRAASTMSDAADRMQRAASAIDTALDRFERRFEELVQRFETAAEKMQPPPILSAAAVPLGIFTPSVFCVRHGIVEGTECAQCKTEQTGG